MAKLTAPKLTAIISGVPYFIPAGADSEAYDLARPDPVLGLQVLQTSFPEAKTYEQAIEMRYRRDAGNSYTGTPAGSLTPWQAQLLKDKIDYSKTIEEQTPRLQQELKAMLNPTQQIYTPSFAASQESGAIGASSIASQMNNSFVQSANTPAKPNTTAVTSKPNAATPTTKKPSNTTDLSKTTFLQAAKQAPGQSIYTSASVPKKPTTSVGRTSAVKPRISYGGVYNQKPVTQPTVTKPSLQNLGMRMQPSYLSRNSADRSNIANRYNRQG